VLKYRSSGGFYDFVGVPAGATLDDPGVSSSTGVVDAADAHLARYGPAFGTKQAGTTLSRMGAAPTVTGDVVRYQQAVGGVPVMAGEIVVSLRPNRELDSILAKTSRATTVESAVVGEDAARDTAGKVFSKSAGQGSAPTVRSLGRWVIDPSLIGASRTLPTYTAWRFEVTRGDSERRLVLVDDQTGSVLMNQDLIAHALKRIVCDNAEVPRTLTNNDEFPCTDPATAARNEGGTPSAVSDVNTAYDLAAAVSSMYAGVGVDLTALIGRTLTGSGAGQKALAQTVRMCYTPAGGGCPYANAFWNGQQMYYGTGFAGADDVVGHEMTHGVTERNSNLIYWGQSGAMNESLSDIMGEIVDHQNVTASDVPATAWALGEDVPGFPTGLRNMQDPTLKGDPDRTGSALYVKEGCTIINCYGDQDGVHSNSGVGNKTFYLISQGGTFNSQTITGVDLSASDADLTRSAKLWMLTDQTLTSGSDYADEAEVLEQSCAALQAASVMTAANCAEVHEATLATELRTTPTQNPQPAARGRPGHLCHGHQARPVPKRDRQPGVQVHRLRGKHLGPRRHHRMGPGRSQCSGFVGGHERRDGEDRVADRRRPDRAAGRAAVVPVLPAVASARVRHRRVLRRRHRRDQRQPDGGDDLGQRPERHARVRRREPEAGSARLRRRLARLPGEPARPDYHGRDERDTAVLGEHGQLVLVPGLGDRRRRGLHLRRHADARQRRQADHQRHAEGGPGAHRRPRHLVDGRCGLRLRVAPRRHADRGRHGLDLHAGGRGRRHPAVGQGIGHEGRLHPR
jgi:Zn-dependent metalloprotease